MADNSKIDLHAHTVRGSDCSVMTPEDLIERAVLVGLDGICITEHDTINRSLELEECARERGLLLLYGVEANTDHGEVLAFGPTEYTGGFYELSNLRRLVDDEGGAIVAAHPFRREFSPFYSKSTLEIPTVEEACARPIMQMVDSLEVINGASTEEECEFGRQVAENLGLAMAGGSDAHSADGIGICVTVFERRITNRAEFLEELRAGRYKPADLRSTLPPMK